jgi:hypothetical protein
MNKFGKMIATLAITTSLVSAAALPASAQNYNRQDDQRDSSDNGRVLLGAGLTLFGLALLGGGHQERHEQDERREYYGQSNGRVYCHYFYDYQGYRQRECRTFYNGETPEEHGW